MSIRKRLAKGTRLQVVKNMMAMITLCVCKKQMPADICRQAERRFIMESKYKSFDELPLMLSVAQAAQGHKLASQVLLRRSKLLLP